MFLKRTRKNKNIDKREQLIKLVASFIFLIGSFMYIGRIAYNYYVELRDYNKAQEFLKIGKEEIEEIKVDIDEEEIKDLESNEGQLSKKAIKRYLFLNAHQTASCDDILKFENEHYYSGN